MYQENETETLTGAKKMKLTAGQTIRFTKVNGGLHFGIIRHTFTGFVTVISEGEVLTVQNEEVYDIYIS